MFYLLMFLIKNISNYIFLIKFATIQLRSCGNEGLYNRVLLKLSSSLKFSQSLNWYEDDSSSTTSMVCTAIIGSCHTFGVGCYCFIRTKAMREAGEMGEANIVPTPLFIYQIHHEGAVR